MKKNILKGLCLLLIFCLGFSAIGCQKNQKTEQTENSEVASSEANNEAINPEEAGMSNDGKGQNNTFKPSDYTLDVKDEYIYEFLGLKFTLSDPFKKAMMDKKVAMLDEQSPVDEELKYAMLTFSKMTEEQKNATIDKMGDGYEKWEKELERVGTIGMFAKDTPEEEITKITNCDQHQKIGTSADGSYDYYLSTNSKTEADLLQEFNNTKVEMIDKKDRPENGFVLSEKTDLENTEAFTEGSAEGLSDLKTKDIEGKEFTSKDFADYDLTMVNVFATWCTACVKEIPDLVEIQKTMKDKGVNIVGVVTDTVDQNGENQEAIDTAKMIQEKTAATYPFLMPDKTNFNGRLNGIQALPETFFVDRNGNIVGETYSGARSAEDWQAVIEKELENVKNK